MSLKIINEKITNKQNKIQWSMQNFMLNKSSHLFCDKCKERLGILRMVWMAKSVKKGVKYYIVCPKCHYLNGRIKGELAKKIDSDWDKYGV